MKKTLSILLAVLMLASTAMFTLNASAHIESTTTYFILRLIADDLQDPVFGAGRVNQCYYPKQAASASVGEEVRTMPEIYVWSTCTITAEGAIGKVTPASYSRAPMFEIDTMPSLDVRPDETYRYFVINVKSSKPLSGVTMNLVSLGNTYKKTFPVDFTGEWQKIVVDLYEDFGWGKKNDKVYDPLTASPYREKAMSVSGGFRVDFPAFYPAEPEIADFNDYYLVDWFGFMRDPEEEILSGDLLTDKTYMKGYSDGSFKPSGNITRAEACTVIARLAAGSDEAVPAPAASRFSDVDVNAWYAKYICYLDSLGYLGAYSGTYSPDQYITRAEFVELVAPLNKAPATQEAPVFSDVPADHPRYNVIMEIAKSGVVGGYSDGTFKPDANITRAEVTKVINVALGRIAFDNTICVKNYQYFTDVDESHWAFDHILEATVEHTYKLNSNNEEKWFGAYIYDNIDYDATAKKIAEIDEKAEALRAEILASDSEYMCFGNEFYVDPDGDDNNDGLSPEKAWKTLNKVNNAREIEEGDAVLFKRGGEWRGQLVTKAGVSYSAYGEGDKPIINASSKDYVNSKWTETAVPNVYELEGFFSSDVGLIVFDGGAERAFKQIQGHLGFEGGIENLANDLDFLWNEANKRVYLRSDKGNPAERFKSIELNEGRHAVRVGGNYVTIDNLHIKHAGFHGVGSGSVKGLYVTNCRFDWIGGSIQGGSGNGTRYGNGVEVYGAAEDYVLDHNIVNQVYDAGLTHQISSGGSNGILYKDIKYTRNLIEYCVYSIEYFVGKPDSDKAERYQDNILIEDNIMRYAGYGFGIQRRDATSPAHIKGWDHMNYLKDGADFIIKNNIFDRSRRMMIHCGAGKAEWLPTFIDNTYVQYIGVPDATIGRYHANPTTNIQVNGAARYVLATMGVEDGADFYYAQPDEISALPIR